ncbi:hypothetical protein SX4_0051 [Vibrio mimicus SX-4]|nr:hypothetical protein SX4_0051 [Vibrio mimicus SX-4]
MSSMMLPEYARSIVDFVADDDGLSVVEYVVGAALLALAIGILFAEYDTKLISKIDAALS